MNGLLIAAMVMGGGAGLAMQSENVNDAVTNTANEFMVKAQKMFKGNRVESIKETGFPYPSEAYLETLTEDQAFQVVSAIDVINVSYDWANMTDEEIELALIEVKAELHDLYTELGIEGPVVQTQTRQGNRGTNGKRGQREDFIPNGDGIPDEDCLTDDEVIDTDAA